MDHHLNNQVVLAQTLTALGAALRLENMFDEAKLTEAALIVYTNKSKFGTLYYITIEGLLIALEAELDINNPYYSKALSDKHENIIFLLKKATKLVAVLKKQR